MLKIFVVSFLILVAVHSQDVITCSFCTSGLASIGNVIQNNPAVRAQLHQTSADSCDEIPNKSQRTLCRQLLGDHFDEILTEIGKAPEAAPLAMCQKMKYC